ncbi:BGTF surface domain-containing protein [Natronobacterium texcoconense]|uniref:PGF-CTERM protein/surface glycoprotein n=1 Tax=Natronobacterium texcoconense TaxID=1095778 RepID=A0A1H1GG60_NATTX|nr:BGTF surface domain-containing protein [Natronobacterium texcoconense]SDR12125.1 PGF-CTERM protein/surface glycoprotein [Natronobacterium texcoconense]
MTGELSRREKGRAAFLAAIMIVSVVAMSALFAGSAAADEGEEPVEITIDYPEVTNEYGYLAIGETVDDFDVTVVATEDDVTIERIDVYVADGDTGAVDPGVTFEETFAGGELELDEGQAWTASDEGDLEDEEPAELEFEPVEAGDIAHEVDVQVAGEDDVVVASEYDRHVHDAEEDDGVADSEYAMYAADVVFDPASLEFEADRDDAEFDLAVNHLRDGEVELDLGVDIGGDGAETSEHYEQDGIVVDDEWDDWDEPLTFSTVDEPGEIVDIDAYGDGANADLVLDIRGIIPVVDPGSVGHEYHEAGPTWEPDDVDTVWSGQEVTLTGGVLDDHSSLVVRPGPRNAEFGDVETAIRVRDDGTATFDTSDLEPGEVYHFDTGDSPNIADSFDQVEFWTDEEDLDVDFTTNTVIEGGEAELSIDSDRDHQHVNVTSEEFDGDDLYGMFVGHDENAYAGDADAHTDDVLTLEHVDASDDTSTFDVSFDDVEPGEYEFEFDTTDSHAWDNATIEVVDDDASVDFAGDAEGQRGDVIEIPIELEHTQAGAVHIGDYEEDNFRAAAEFTVDSHDVDEVTLQFDTSAANASGDAWRIPETSGGELTDDTFTDAAFSDRDDVVLGAHDYEMVAGTDYNDSAALERVETDEETDTAFFTVQEPEPVSGVDFEIAPAGTDFGDYEDYDDAERTASSTVAHGDELVLILEDYGMSGDVSAHDYGDGIGEMLTTSGMNITVEERDPGPNVAATTWSTYPGAEDRLDANATVTDLAQYDGDLVAHVDYDGADLDVGSYDLTFEATEESIFAADAEETIEIETEFEIVDPEFDLYPTNDEIPNAADADVIGTTNVAPGSAVESTAESPGNFTDSASAVVADDGTFTVEYDFSEYEPGIAFELEAYHDDRAPFDGDDHALLEDDVDAVLVGVPSSPIDLEATAPDDVEPGEAATLDVTVSNDDSAADDVDVTVTIDDEDVEDTTVVLETGDTWSESFDFDTSTEGDVDWVVIAGFDTRSGILTVGEKEEKEESDPEPVDDDDDEDGTPGFEVAVAVVALLATAMLALRRQD